MRNRKSLSFYRRNVIERTFEYSESRSATERPARSRLSSISIATGSRSGLAFCARKSIDRACITFRNSARRRTADFTNYYNCAFIRSFTVSIAILSTVSFFRFHLFFFPRQGNPSIAQISRRFFFFCFLFVRCFARISIFLPSRKFDLPARKKKKNKQTKENYHPRVSHVFSALSRPSPSHFLSL